MTPRVEQIEQGTCGCGRSPTGNCVGWHRLTEDEYKKKLVEWTEATRRQDLLRGS